jgi:hypothetical protein
MESCCHWLTELAEAYTSHAARHGPNRLLPAEVLPTPDRMPGHGGASPQGAGPNGRMVGHAAPKACRRHELTERRNT